MSGPLYAAPRPCVSCPYRVDCPSGVWALSEYEKLREYDDQPSGIPAIGTFHCHQENAIDIPTVCRGWLTVHADSIAVRLAIMDGRVTVEQRDAPVAEPLFESGVAAADHGEGDLIDPSPEAVAMQLKLLRGKAGRL